MSPDGLTLYWQSTAGGQRWIWCAERKNKEAPFENQRRLMPGTDPTVSDDGIEMILLDGKNLASATRQSVAEPFSRPRMIVEPRGVGLRAPCLTPDGLALYAGRVRNDQIDLVRFTRQTRRDPWTGPTTVTVAARRAEGTQPIRTGGMFSTGAIPYKDAALYEV